MPKGKYLIPLGIVVAIALLREHIPYPDVAFMLFFAALIIVTIYIEHRAHQALKELEKERQARDQFVATLTHDLQTPLTAAKLNAEMALRDLGNEHVSQNAIAGILSHVERMESMIRDLLDVSQVRSGKPLPVEVDMVNLSDLVHSTVQELVPIHGFRFVVEAEENIAGLYSTKGIKRIIENLCSNAVKYGDASSPIKVGLQRNGKMARLLVNNKGRPIPPKQVKTLFEAYGRSKDSLDKKGWGLGLTLVKGLAEAHGGRVEVSSQLADGTTFSVFLPLDAPELT